MHLEARKKSSSRRLFKATNNKKMTKMAIIDLQNVRIFLTAVSDSNIRKTTTLKVALLATMIKARPSPSNDVV